MLCASLDFSATGGTKEIENPKLIQPEWGRECSPLFKLQNTYHSCRFIGLRLPCKYDDSCVPNAYCHRQERCECKEDFRPTLDLLHCTSSGSRIHRRNNVAKLAAIGLVLWLGLRFGDRLIPWLSLKFHHSRFKIVILNFDSFFFDWLNSNVNVVDWIKLLCEPYFNLRLSLEKIKRVNWLFLRPLIHLGRPLLCLRRSFAAPSQ